MSIGGIAAEALQQYVDRIERLEEEKRTFVEDIKQVYSEAKSTGFDTKILRKVITLRKLPEHERKEQAELTELYMAAIGMADQPLSDNTRRRFQNQKTDEEMGEPDEPTLAEPPPPLETSIEDARAMGRKAAEEGIPVSANPFPAGDPRRAAWDEEWCRSTGSDGMEIPEAFKRKKKPKKDGNTKDDKKDEK